jgi:heavy metal sensor kinase
MRPSRFRSVRAVLSYWLAALFVGSYIIFAATVHAYLKDVVYGNLERELAVEVDWIRRTLTLEGESPPGGEVRLPDGFEIAAEEHLRNLPRTYMVTIVDRSGNVLYRRRADGFPPRLPPPPGEGNAVIRVSDLPDGRVRIASGARGSFVVHVGFPEGEIQAILRSLRMILIVVGLVMVFASLLGAWVLLGRVLHPIGVVADRAAHINAENLSERLPERRVRDEFGKLIHAFNGMTERLEVSFERMRAFSLNVAHEVKTPLTILSGESELALYKDLDKKEVQELAATYLEETARINRIIDDLLILSKGDVGEIELELGPVAMDDLVRDVWEDATILASGKNLDVQLGATPSVEIRADAVRLRQLVRAIVSNAVRYTDPGGTIRIGLESEPGWVTLRVEDTGIGIPAEHLPHIFERFYRVEGSRSRDKGGSGLGLAVARSLALAHGGDISVTSRRGEGSVFTVRLPLVPPPRITPRA